MTARKEWPCRRGARRQFVILCILHCVKELAELGGGDKAQTAGAIGGAVIGGIAGNAAGKAVGKQQGYAYIVRFSTGDVKEIIQGADVYIAPGTPVDIIAGADGWKLVPAGGY